MILITIKHSYSVLNRLILIGCGILYIDDNIGAAMVEKAFEKTKKGLRSGQ